MKIDGHRPELDGLRAYAIAGVLLFHLGVRSAQGGFWGVDAFFVLSGYLITGLLVREHEQHGRLDLKRFYLRRLRRLYPALLFTVLVTVVASALVLIPQDREAMAPSVVGSVLSFSNLVFFAEHGYFDAEASLKPLLHTWSLSVEEQFYLVWPALCAWLLARRRSLVGPLGGVGAISWLVALLVLTLLPKLWPASSAWSTQAAFFLTPCRIFEFCVGAVLVPTGLDRVSKPMLRDALVLMGLVSLIGAMILSSGSTHPAPLVALVPCFATAAVIAGGAGRAGQLLLGNSPAVGLGRISYSVYLVHWPLIVLYQYQLDHELRTLDRLLLTAASVALGWAVHRGVEQGFRATRERRGWLSTPVFLGSVLAVASVCVAVGIGFARRSAISVSTSNPSALERQRQTPMKEFRSYNERPQKKASRRFRNDGKPRVLLLGDSQASDIANALMEGGLAERLDLAFFHTSTHCQVLVGIPFAEIEPLIREREHVELCRRNHAELEASPLLAQAQFIVLAPAFRDWSAMLTPRVVANLAKMGAQVRVVGPKTIARDGLKQALEFRGQPLSAAQAAFKFSEAQVANNALLSRTLPRRTYVDLMRVYCPSPETCAPFTDEGAAHFFDQMHLTREGAGWLGRRLRENNLLKLPLGE